VSPRKIAPSTRSGRQNIARRGSALTSLSPDQLSDRHPKRIIFDSGLEAESGRLGPPMSCRIEELPRWKPTHLPSGRDAEDLAELVDANRLFANLALHHVRPHDCSATDAGKQTCSYDPHLGCVSVPVVNVRSPLTLGSGRAVRIVQAASPDPLLAPIETLFAELARRHLRSLATKESPG
jgi:hypothetical protein